MFGSLGCNGEGLGIWLRGLDCRVRYGVHNGREGKKQRKYYCVYVFVISINIIKSYNTMYYSSLAITHIPQFPRESTP